MIIDGEEEGIWPRGALVGGCAAMIGLGTFLFVGLELSRAWQPPPLLSAGQETVPTLVDSPVAAAANSSAAHTVDPKPDQRVAELVAQVNANRVDLEAVPAGLRTEVARQLCESGEEEAALRSARLDPGGFSSNCPAPVVVLVRANLLAKGRSSLADAELPDHVFKELGVAPIAALRSRGNDVYFAIKPYAALVRTGAQLPEDDSRRLASAVRRYDAALRQWVTDGLSLIQVHLSNGRFGAAEGEMRDLEAQADAYATLGFESLAGNQREAIDRVRGEIAAGLAASTTAGAPSGSTPAEDSETGLDAKLQACSPCLRRQACLYDCAEAIAGASPAGVEGITADALDACEASRCAGLPECSAACEVAAQRALECRLEDYSSSDCRTLREHMRDRGM